MPPKKPKISVDLVIPVYNEEGVVEQTYAEICKVIDASPHKFSIYYIDDGSEDGTVASLNSLAKKDKRVVVLELSRNFGHQAALDRRYRRRAGRFCHFDGRGRTAPA